MGESAATDCSTPTAKIDVTPARRVHYRLVTRNGCRRIVVCVLCSGGRPEDGPREESSRFREQSLSSSSSVSPPSPPRPNTAAGQASRTTLPDRHRRRPDRPGQGTQRYAKHFILTADIDLDPNLPGNRVFDDAVIAPDMDATEAGFQGPAFTGSSTARAA